MGSYSRNEQTEGSDLDLLVDFEKNVNLLDMIGAEQELTELLDIKVDLVSHRSLHKKLRDYINKDLIRFI